MRRCPRGVDTARRCPESKTAAAPTSAIRAREEAKTPRCGPRSPFPNRRLVQVVATESQAGHSTSWTLRLLAYAFPGVMPPRSIFLTAQGGGRCTVGWSPTARLQEVLRYEVADSIPLAKGASRRGHPGEVFFSSSFLVYVRC